MSKIIGIDLGTTNSCVAVMEGGSPKVIHSAEGRNVIPSVVDPINHIIGDVAKRQIVVKTKSTIFSVKRLMGRKYNDKSVQFDQKWLPYSIKSGRDGMAVVEVDGRLFTPQEISAMILQKIKADAESYLGSKVTQAVITVPAYFDDSQRQATKQAGEIAGLEVLRIINEPTAAALAYGLDKKNAHTVAIFDLGGGTFDISILELGEGLYQVKATNGDTHLGGDDFDKKILDYLADEFKKENNIDLRKDSQALQRIRDAAEKAKIELSSASETEINQPFITQGPNGPLHLTLKLTRAKMESIIDDLVKKTIEPVKKCLQDAGLSKSDINEVVLVGGMTRMPKVYEAVKEFFGKEPNRSVNPDEVVAVGAAVQAGVLGGEVKDVLLLDVTPLTLGIETLGGVSTSLIQRNTTIPSSKSQVFSTAADNQTQVEINVLQGERAMAVDNKSLGRFILDGIPSAPRGIPQIEVTFDIDANGILNVKALDKASNREQKITITGSTGLSKEEVEKMTKEAEIHAKEDQNKKALIDEKNKADTLIFTAEKTLKESKDKIKQEEKKEIEDKISKLREVLNTENKEEIASQAQILSDLLQKIAQTISSQDQSASSKKPEAKNENTENNNKNDQKNEERKKEEPVEGEVIQ